MVDLHQGAVLGQRLGVEMAGVFAGRVHEEQRQGVVIGLAHQFQGFGPGFFVDDDRQHLGREERAVVDRDDIDLVRQVLPGQRQAGAGSARGVGIVKGVFGVGL